MILQTLSNFWIQKHISFTALLRMSAAVISRLSPEMISHIITSVRVINLFYSTPVNDFTANKVIDLFDFLVFNNCWCIFDSMCHFCQHIYMKSRFCIRIGQSCILLFEIMKKMKKCHWWWYESLYYCCDFLFLFRGVRWSFSPSLSKSLHAKVASCLTFLNVWNRCFS